jgi:acetyl-CoA carboxylase carboxyl transferase subunit beta
MLLPCPHCNYHEKVGSDVYFNLLFDDNEFIELDANLTSGDPLHFVDTKAYPDRIKSTMHKTGLKDAVRTGHGKMNEMDIVIACMDFNFIGGSMGSVVGEKNRPGHYLCARS